MAIQSISDTLTQGFECLLVFESHAILLFWSGCICHLPSIAILVQICEYVAHMRLVDLIQTLIVLFAPTKVCLVINMALYPLQVIERFTRMPSACNLLLPRHFQTLPDRISIGQCYQDHAVVTTHSCSCCRCSPDTVP